MVELIKSKLLIDKDKLISIRNSFIISSIAILLSLLVGAIVIKFMGYSPLAAYGALLKGSMGNFKMFLITLKKAVPLIFSGLAVAVAFKSSVFNIGVEGQFLAGAMAAALAGLYVSLPAPLHILFTVVAAALGGMLSAFIPALLKRFFNVGVVISTIMFNYIVILFVQFLVVGPFRGSSSAQATNTILDTAKLPRLLPKPFQMNFGVIIMLLVVVFVYILLNKTSTGYEMRMVGLNSTASKVQGINADKNMFLALLISGAIAGIGGGVEVTGSLNKIVLGFSTGYGYSGIPIALIAQSNPIAILLSGFFFGMMSSGSLLMQSSVGVSPDIVDLIKGLVVAFLCTEHFILYYLNKMKAKRSEK